jgi:antitoxin component of RelBE/YafQ-DinJ toxin-antitoxin module
MNFDKRIRQGKKTALRHTKDPVLITFQANRTLREDAINKCGKMGINLSAYLRICVEKLIELPIDYHIENMYKEIIKEAVSEITED